MRYTAYYLIEHRPELRERLASLKELDLEDLLLEAELLSNEEGGKTIFLDNEHTLTIKLLFLARVKEYEPLSSDAMFERVFGSPRLSTDLFDRWWTIRRLEVTEDAESLYPMLRQFFHLVDQTDNNLVNEWLERVRADRADSDGV
jgi:hypothetical protein